MNNDDDQIDQVDRKLINSILKEVEKREKMLDEDDEN